MTDICRKTVKSRLHEEVEGYTGSCFHRTKDKHLNASFRNVVHEGQRSQIVEKFRLCLRSSSFCSRKQKLLGLWRQKTPEWRWASADLLLNLLNIINYQRLSSLFTVSFCPLFNWLHHLLTCTDSSNIICFPLQICCSPPVVWLRVSVSDCTWCISTHFVLNFFSTSTQHKTSFMGKLINLCQTLSRLCLSWTHLPCLYPKHGDVECFWCISQDQHKSVVFLMAAPD